MALSPTTSSQPAPPCGSTKPVKYRDSCDRCLNMKNRCSHEKPTCKRCAKKGVGCVYSPYRRIGRPKKACHADFIHDENTSTPSTLASTPAGSLRDGHHGSSSVPRTVVSTTSAITAPENGLGSWDSSRTDTPMTDAHDGSIGNGNQRIHPSQPDQVSGSSNGGHTQTPSPGRNTKTNAKPKETSTGEVPINSHLTPPALDPRTNCYVAILTRTTTLEQSLATSPQPPLLDLVLSAEQDVRELKHRLFTCTGHGHGHTISSSDTNPNTKTKCLASSRPVLLTLALLAESVVKMLEDIFLTTSQEIQDICSNPNTQSPALSACCLIPETNLDIRIGEYVVEGPVKARAVKRILQLRVRKLLAILEDMKMRNVPQREGRGVSIAVLDKVAGSLVEDLIRRLEALQVGMGVLE